MQRRDAVLITLDYPPERGGVARYLGELVQASQGQMRVILDTLHDPTGPGLIQRYSFFWRGWPRWLPLVRVCRMEVRPDEWILVSHVFPVGTAAWISRLLGGPSYSVLFHGLDLRLARNWWKRWLLRQICLHADRLFVVSESTKRELLERVPEAQVQIVTPGVEDHQILSRTEARRTLKIPEESKIVLSVARLIPRKGIDIALHALSVVQTSLDGVEYVVIGTGPDEERLRSLAKQLGVRVRWLGDVSDEEKWLWYSAADVFLLPVREEKDDIEGFGIVFLEAALAGVPSVAGASGGVVEAVLDGQTGIIVDPQSEKEIADAVRRLLENDELRLRLGNQARERASKDFQWSDRWKLISEESSPGCHSSEGRSLASAAAVSVVIPCFNHATELRQTLEALTRQTLLPQEIVVIDDGSSDHPDAVVQEFIHCLPLKFVRFDECRGAPAARNEGARQTSSPLILFLDADATLVPDALESFVCALDDHPEVDFAYSSFFWGNKRFAGKPFNFDELKHRNFIHTSSLLRRSAFPGFDETIKKFQDWDLWLTMSKRGSKGLWIERELFRIEPRRDGISRWLPRIAYRIPWRRLGFVPEEIRRSQEAERIIRTKHHI